MQYYASMNFDFMGAPAPLERAGSGVTEHLEYFQNYRNEHVSRMKVPVYDWDKTNTPYTLNPDVSAYMKSNDKYLHIPQSEFTMIDRGRHKEVEDFYIACQLHRDQYRAESGLLRPLDYFKKADFMYQCPTDPQTQYMKYPEFYVKYKQPIVFPVTLERTYRSPTLPSRALTGVYNRSSDMAYKR